MSKNVYEIVTEKIIEELQKGNVPWRKPWKGQKAINYISRKEYKGINTLLLPFPGEYLTFKQCKDQKGNVKKGEKSHMIVYYQWYEKQVDKDGKTEIQKLPVLKYYNVFHISQCEGIESKCKDFTVENSHNIIIEANSIINEYIQRESISFKTIIGSDRAYYSPSSDEIVLPEIGQFISNNEYYSTAFHECIHSTGNEKRLLRFNTEKNHKFGSKEYSKEELVAEIGSTFLCDYVNIDVKEVFTNSVAYIQGWLQSLKDDQKMVVFASSQAQKAVNYILNIKDDYNSNSNNEE